MEDYYKDGEELRKIGGGAFYPDGKEPKHEEVVAQVIADVKAKGFYARPVSSEEEANAVIRTFRCPRRIKEGKEWKRYCGYQLFFKDYWSGNFTADDGTVNGDSWCRDEHEVWVKHPVDDEVLYDKAEFEDVFYWIEKDE